MLVNVGKCWWFFSDKHLLQKAAALKRFEYFSLGKELKAQIDIAKKQHQQLDDTNEFHEIINKKSKLKITGTIENQI